MSLCVYVCEVINFNIVDCMMYYFFFLNGIYFWKVFYRILKEIFYHFESNFSYFFLLLYLFNNFSKILYFYIFSIIFQ